MGRRSLTVAEEIHISFAQPPGPRHHLPMKCSFFASFPVSGITDATAFTRSPDSLEKYDLQRQQSVPASPAAATSTRRGRNRTYLWVVKLARHNSYRVNRR